MKILRRWTDVDGIACTELAGDSELSLRGLRELLNLFMALRERADRQAVAAGEMIPTARSKAEAVDDQAARVGVSRTGGSRGAVGTVSGISQSAGHAAVCALDGACVGGANSRVEKPREESGGAR
jgi:hypothetical protein